MSDLKEDPKALGEAVKRARKGQGLKQKDLAGLCNTGVRFISDLENGKASCQLGLALKVARRVGVRLSMQEPVISKTHTWEKEVAHQRRTDKKYAKLLDQKLIRDGENPATALRIPKVSASR
jgi:HTH-type transcriptional regulator/antitoxin HipB